MKRQRSRISGKIALVSYDSHDDAASLFITVDGYRYSIDQLAADSYYSHVQHSFVSLRRFRVMENADSRKTRMIARGVKKAAILGFCWANDISHILNQTGFGGMRLESVSAFVKREMY